jgi:hypothetical protein
MARGILSEFGPDADKPQAARATSGGITMEQKKDVMGYANPVGPTTFGHNSPGLAQRNNYGNAGSQGKYSNEITTSGASGIVRKGGTNEGEEGSQHG